MPPCNACVQVRQVVSGAYRGVPRRVEPLGPEALLGSPNTMSKVGSFSGSKVGISALEAMASTNSGRLAAPVAPAAARACSPSQARVLYHPTAGHADWLLDNAWQVGGWCA